MADNKKFVNYLQKELKSKDVSKTKQAIIYRYFGEKKKSIELFRSITTFEMPNTRFSVIGITEDDKKNTRFLISVGKNQLVKGIRFNLAEWRIKDAEQFFIWASENCFIPENTFREWLDIGQYDEIAVGFLWRGYALLLLGKYKDAYDLLKQVPVYFNKWKLSGSDVGQIYEPKLVKALLPLCEYKLHPIEENREKAKKGIEDYIKSFGEPKFKLEGYLYYYHLREMSPEVYSEIPYGEKPIGEAPVKGSIKLADMASQDIVKDIKFEEGYDLTKESVSVSDTNGYYIDDFGTAKDLLDYVDKVKRMGGYPLLSSLMDVYGVEDTSGFEPESLIEECKRLLSASNDPWLREKTESILNVAKGALKEGTGVILSMK